MLVVNSTIFVENNAKTRAQLANIYMKVSQFSRFLYFFKTCKHQYRSVRFEHSTQITGDFCTRGGRFTILNKFQTEEVHIIFFIYITSVYAIAMVFLIYKARDSVQMRKLININFVVFFIFAYKNFFKNRNTFFQKNPIMSGNFQKEIKIAKNLFV